MADRKRKLYLIGAGELGREIESWISFDDKFLTKWEIVGFLDDNNRALDNYPSDYLIVGSPSTFKFIEEDAAIICIANPKIKKQIIDKIGGGVEFISYISSKVTLAKFVKIGKGTVICPNTIISTNTTIKDYTTINCGCLIGHDCFIDEYSSLMAHVDLGGNVRVGKNTYLGTKSTIIQGKYINDNIKVGAGSVVIRNLKKEGTYFGNPASLLKY